MVILEDTGDILHRRLAAMSVFIVVRTFRQDLATSHEPQEVVSLTAISLGFQD